jgi:hydrogenase nickel insertion protein HypA
LHEAAIAQAVLDTALEALPDKDSRITAITVVAGVLAGVEEECLTAYFNELCKCTAAEGACLRLVIEPAHLICKECDKQTNYAGDGRLALQCSACGGFNRLEGGKALYLDSVEVES